MAGSGDDVNKAYSPRVRIWPLDSDANSHLATALFEHHSCPAVMLVAAGDGLSHVPTLR